jgi:hypothetical protein
MKLLSWLAQSRYHFRSNVASVQIAQEHPRAPAPRSHHVRQKAFYRFAKACPWASIACRLDPRFPS